jgi:hypothetical protein
MSGVISPRLLNNIAFVSYGRELTTALVPASPPQLRFLQANLLVTVSQLQRSLVAVAFA